MATIFRELSDHPLYIQESDQEIIRSTLPTSVLWLDYFGWNMTIHRKESPVFRRKLLKMCIEEPI